MDGFDIKKMSGLQGLLIGLLLIYLMSPVLLQGVSSNAYSETVKKFDTITVNQFTRDFDIKVQTIKDTYNQQGKLYYRVEFRIIELNELFVCSIPEDKAESLNKDALYIGTVTLGYPKEVCEYAVEENKKAAQNAGTTYDISPEDLSLKTSTVREIEKIDFMYSEYIDTEFKSLDEINRVFNDTFSSKQSNMDSKGNTDGETKS